MMLVQLSDQNFKRKRKRHRHRHRQTHLVTPPTEEAHDRSLFRYLTILLQSIRSSHYFGELLGKKETKKELNASLTRTERTTNSLLQHTRQFSILQNARISKVQLNWLNLKLPWN